MLFTNQSVRDSCYKICKNVDYSKHNDDCANNCTHYYEFMATYTKIMSSFHFILTTLIIGFLIRSICLKWEIAAFSWIGLLLLIILQITTISRFLLHDIGDDGNVSKVIVSLDGISLTLFMSISLL